MPLLDEGLIPLAEARLLLPARGGSHPTADTLRGHIAAGRLDGTLVGGAWFTSREAVSRFVEAGRPGVKERSKAAAERAGAKAVEDFFREVAADKGGRRKRPAAR